MSRPAVVIATAKLREKQEDAFAAWQVRFNEAIAKAPGFISSDVTPSQTPGDHKWIITLNFESSGQLADWQKSPERGRLIDDLLPLLKADKLEQVITEDNAEQHGTDITQMVLSRIKPGAEAAYRAWVVKIQQAQANYPGYRGMYLQPPGSGSGGHWTTLLRYDTREHLDAWLASPERAKLLDEAKVFIEDQELMRLATSFPGWVPVDPATGQGPPNWKTALLVLLGLFPIVMLQQWLLVPLIDQLHFNRAVTTFFCNMVTVMFTGYLTMPYFVRWFDWWLFANDESSRETNAKGFGILSALFLIEIALCWIFLT